MTAPLKVLAPPPRSYSPCQLREGRRWNTTQIFNVVLTPTEIAYFCFISPPSWDKESSLPVLLITTLKYTFFPHIVLGATAFPSTYWTCAKYRVCSHSIKASDLGATTSSCSQCFFIQTQRTSPRLQFRKNPRVF